MVYFSNSICYVSIKQCIFLPPKTLMEILSSEPAYGGVQGLKSKLWLLMRTINLLYAGILYRPTRYIPHFSCHLDAVQTILCDQVATNKNLHSA
jgi:hypothetical protein